QSPVLAGRIEYIRRRADREPVQNDVLLHPGVGTGGIDADGDVDIEPDRQPATTRDLLARAQLAVGDPLQIGMKAELLRLILAQGLQRLLAGSSPRGRPIVPRRIKPPTQRLERGEALEGRS